MTGFFARLAGASFVFPGVLRWHMSQILSVSTEPGQSRRAPACGRDAVTLSLRRARGRRPGDSAPADYDVFDGDREVGRIRRMNAATGGVVVENIVHDHSPKILRNGGIA